MSKDTIFGWGFLLGGIVGIVVHAYITGTLFAK
jgi:hypothetical protein